MLKSCTATNLVGSVKYGEQLDSPLKRKKKEVNQYRKKKMPNANDRQLDFITPAALAAKQ